MVLLSEQEELNYRLMRRSLLECFSAAPVTGLQAYMRSNDSLVDLVGPSYISPYGGKKAPLRNMGLAQMISIRRLLRDGRYTLCRIATGYDTARHNITDLKLWAWV